MTAEVAGLPVAANAQTPQFQHVRDQFKEFFQSTGQQLPGSSYRIFPDPVPVTVTGSVFFDVQPRVGQVHSRNAAPGTVWENDPVTDIVFVRGGWAVTLTSFWCLPGDLAIVWSHGEVITSR